MRKSKLVIKRRIIQGMCMSVCSLLFMLVISSGFTAKADRAFLSEYISVPYDENSDVPLTSANSIIQTDDGHIWIAGFDGLIRYDGLSIKTFHNEDGFPSSNVNSLYEDSNKNLWIATNDSGVVLYKDGLFRTFGLTDGLASASVRSITEDSKGNIWLALAAGLSYITPDLVVNMEYDPEIMEAEIRHIEITDEDKIICVTGDGRVLIVKDGSVETEYHPGYFYGLDITCVYKDLKGIIFFGTMQDKVVVSDTEKNTSTVYKTDGRTGINGFYEDMDGRVWICSDTGLGFFKDYRYVGVDGIEDGMALQGMIQDYEGSYWLVSSNKGIIQFTKSKFKNMSFLCDLPGTNITAVCEYMGKIFIGAIDGLTAVDKETQSQTYNDLTSYLRGINVKDLYCDKSGNLWVSTFNRLGLIRYREHPDGNTEITYFNSNLSGMISDNIRFVYETSLGDIYVSTSDGLCVIRGDEIIKVINADSGLKNTTVLSIAELKDGTMFFGTDGGGLYIYSEGIIQTLTEREGMPSGVIMRTVTDPERDGIWISTGNSVVFYKDDKLHMVEKLDDYGNAIDIKIMKNDGICLIYSNGVMLCDRENLLSDEPLDCTFLKKKDGLTSPVSPYSRNVLGDDGKLYISGSSGILMLDTEKIEIDTVVPKVKITSINIDDVEYPVDSSIVIPSGSERITVGFAVLSFTSSHNNTVKAMLHGFSQSQTVGSVWEMGSHISFTNLQGGMYTFELIGINSNGISAPALTIDIEKKLKFFEHKSVIISSVIIVVSLIIIVSGVFYRRREKEVIKRQQEYKEITNQSIKAISETIDAKDPYTSGHSERVAEYALEIGRRLELSPHELENLYYTALLHDIGKVGLSDAILKKPDRLTDEEFDQMKRHVTIGGEILNSITIIENISAGAKYHHERYDGKGYATGLAGDDIPLFARIICVADAYDAMSSDRVYRSALSREYIVDELDKCAGSHFDARIAEIMVNMLKEGVI